MMRLTEKIIAIRLKSIYHGKAGLEKRDPALRNINEALLDNGLAYDIDGCGCTGF